MQIWIRVLLLDGSILYRLGCHRYLHCHHQRQNKHKGSDMNEVIKAKLQSSSLTPSIEIHQKAMLRPKSHTFPSALRLALLLGQVPHVEGDQGHTSGSGSVDGPELPGFEASKGKDSGCCIFGALKIKIQLSRAYVTIPYFLQLRFLALGFDSDLQGA